MIIYGNNLHEKLQGLAISRDYLKYNTPFCDMVDDPYWETDINLALNFQSALNGDLDAATKLVEDLTLNSNVLDNSTIEWYLTKITYNPIFSSAISRMRARFTMPAMFSDSFQDALIEALKDCLNSPCNLFANTSDSIATMADHHATKNSANTFGSILSGAASDIGQGLKSTFTSKLPAVFTNGFTEIVTVAKKGFENTQDVLAGKEKLSIFNERLEQGESFRNVAAVFGYTPDVKSYYDYSAASSNILTAIKAELGGCFDRFQYKKRYNPYTSGNTSRPINKTEKAIDGKKAVADPSGTIDRPVNNSSRQKEVVENIVDQQLDVVEVAQIDPKFEGKIPNVTTGADVISKSFLIKHQSTDSSNYYSLFGAWWNPSTPGRLEINVANGYDGGSKRSNQDSLITQGITTDLGTSYKIMPTILGSEDSFIKSVFENIIKSSEQTLQQAEKHSNTFPGMIALGYGHNLTNRGMEDLYNTTDVSKSDRLFVNDGVRISKGLWIEFINLPELKNRTDTSEVSLIKENKLFVAVKSNSKPSGEWSFFKVLEVKDNLPKDINVDFTPGAFEYLAGQVGTLGLDPVPVPVRVLDNITSPSAELGGAVKYNIVVPNKRGVGNLDIRLCIGESISTLKSTINDLDADKTSVEASVEEPQASAPFISKGSNKGANAGEGNDYSKVVREAGENLSVVIATDETGGPGPEVNFEDLPGGEVPDDSFYIPGAGDSLLPQINIEIDETTITPPVEAPNELP